jgi:cell division protein FtsB
MLVHVMFGPNGMVIYRQKRAEYKQLQSENEHLKTENHQYEQQNRALRSDPKTIEKVARESMGYARAGEVVYVPPAPADPAKPAVNTASK